MEHTDNLLSRLEGVKSLKPGQWVALCPAHGDKHPSLYVKESETGNVLLHCQCGCSTRDVLAAVGLSMRALFPNERRTVVPKGPRVDLEYEKLFVLAYRSSFMDIDADISLNDTLRYGLATQRLSQAGIAL